jgi:tetratricopeptide (TPR) repeat protein
MPYRSTEVSLCGVLVGFLFLFGVVSPSASAQDPFNSMGSMTTTTQSYESRMGGTIFVLTVYAADGKALLDRQAVVKATNLSSHTVNWQATDDNSQAPMELMSGPYDLEVSAVGYLSEHRQINVVAATSSIRIEVPLHPDPTAMDLRISESALPAKARKEAKQAVSALKSGKLKDARKKLEAADKIDPSNSDLNYLLGYLSYQEKDFVQAEKYLTNATRIDSRHLQANTLLGQIQLSQQEYQAGSVTLERAVGINPGYWVAHNMLADAYLKLKMYDKARQEAEIAINSGKDGSNAANLILGQAMINLGKNQDGIRALKAFVRDCPKNPVVPEVNDLIKTVEASASVPVGKGGSAQPGASSFPGVDPLLATTDLPLSIKSWQPKGIDEARPAVAAGVNCPASDVIEKAGDRVRQFADDVGRIGAIEHLLHEQMDEMGNPATRETRSYNYIASISEPKPGFVQVDEDRSERLTRFEFPDAIASSGFMGLALVFHPSMQENFEMACEGLGRWHGQAAWLVHFKQREDRPARFHDYRVGGDLYSLRIKGRAWITADKFQVVRIESELMSPMPQIQLRNEQQVVEYGPVLFHDKNLELWLPQKAEIYLDLHKHRYYRSHTFDHYMLFSVDSDEKRNEPKAPPADQPIKN